MPHPRKHLKQTGDVHPPEIEDELAGDEAGTGAGTMAAAAPQQREVGQGTVDSAAALSRTMRFSAPTERVFDAAREQVRRKPIAFAAGAFAVGFVLAIVTR